MTKQIGEIVKTVDGVKTDFSVGNLPTKLTPGGPGSDSSLARYLANIWRSSYHSGGIWFGFEKDNGYMGFAATDAEVADEIKILFRDLAAQEEKLSVDQESLTQSEMSVLRSALCR